MSIPTLQNNKKLVYLLCQLKKGPATMDREPIEMNKNDVIHCLKALSDYHPEICEECKYFGLCDHTTQSDIFELAIKLIEENKIERKVM